MFCWMVAATLALGIRSQPFHHAPDKARWSLVWSDEFSGPAGAAPDPKYWTYDIGGNGWGNQELEYYTGDRANSYLDGKGHLIIEARRQQKGGRDYTSARLKTQGLFSHGYGRFEARIKIPYGQGIWPAFWLLGDNIGSVGWPRCGEMDIMENIGKEPDKVHGSVHGPGYDFTRTYQLPQQVAFYRNYHVYGVQWTPDQIQFSVDGNVYGAYHKSDLAAGQSWVFDKPIFILLNVAVGGNWPGSPNATTRFPQKMLVDWVRIYSAG
ncbi:MAG TPA: glycoside hydrolase family 16 protein [Chthonomonadales bacterium]|nr:glycoside hydrolase family 16 protein [Chthonomonadales bacterium]